MATCASATALTQLNGRFKETLQYALPVDPSLSPPPRYGPINELNELLGLAACGQDVGFGQAVLVSNSAVQRHARHDSLDGARGFEAVNSVIAKSIVLTTSSLRVGPGQFRDALGKAATNSLPNLESLTSHLNGNGTLPRYSCLAWDTKTAGMRVWASNSIFSRRDLQLSPFSVDSGLRLRSVT